MRIGMLVVMAACCWAIAAVAAGAAAPGDQGGPTTGRPVANAAPQCPPGSRWIPEGYEKHGKYRPAHCSVKR